MKTYTISQMAKELKVNRQTLSRRIDRLGLKEVNTNRKHLNIAKEYSKQTFDLLKSEYDVYDMSNDKNSNNNNVSYNKSYSDEVIEILKEQLAHERKRYDDLSAKFDTLAENQKALNQIISQQQYLALPTKQNDFNFEQKTEVETEETKTDEVDDLANEPIINKERLKEVSNDVVSATKEVLQDAKNNLESLLTRVRSKNKQ